MRRLNEQVMLAFKDELEKTAVSPRVGASATLGVLGALGGGGLGYLRNRFAGEEEGGAGAAAKGALMGGLAGAGVGAALPSGAGKAVSRFGMRELHGLTGYMPQGESLRTLHAGAYPAQVAEAQARRGLAQASRAGGDTGKAMKTWQRTRGALGAMQEAEQHGLTNLPGIASAARKEGLVPTLTRGAKAQFTGSHPVNKGLMMGLPALGIASAVKSHEIEGVGKGEEIGWQGGNLVGGLAGGVLPLGTGQVLQAGAGRVGRAVGRGVDVLRGKGRRNPPSDFRAYGPHPSESSDLTKATGEATPKETIMTARASGTPPESQV